ncbi:hypothetical protein JKA74_09720 [Marivirga sp. S37H4]|uniref:Uncharacterized protein n=1 Tax=Marivirga aurantiaca TaxID=2802615 RepID=A0A935CBD7_9BACT|nr:hypothetical protein [Marivirga aurantiaca]MBK6265318.1 hypothetical protein [Marivirga aurantiaca]
MENYFTQFPHIVTVEGKDAAAIYDFKHEVCHKIPLVLFEIMQDLKHHSSKSIELEYGSDNSELLNKFFYYIKVKKWGRWGEHKERVQELDLNWYCPAHIQNVQLEWSTTYYNFPLLMEQLNELLCRHIEIRADLSDSSKFHKFIKDLGNLNHKCFRTVELHLDIGFPLTTKLIDDLVNASAKIENVMLYGLVDKPLTEQKRVKWISSSMAEILTENSNSGPYENKYIVNLSFFCESQQYNPYYNRKIGITEKGAIKNCLKLDKVFGNVNDPHWMKIIETEDFQLLWHASADKIIDVKDNELRYSLFITQPLEMINNQQFKLTSSEFKT